MDLIPGIIKDLRRDEGWVPHAYKDSLGFWTIGYGFLIDESRGGELPERVADYWLTYLVMDTWDRLHDALPWLQEQPEDVQRALGNMAYQLGVNGVLGFQSMLDALQCNDRKGAAKHALDSKWARDQTPDRAKRVASLIRGSK